MGIFEFKVNEIRNLTISALVLAFAFSFREFSFSLNYLLPFSKALLIIGIAFLCHELSHRTMGRSFGAYSVYKLWLPGIFLAILLAIVSKGSIIFAAPGFVQLQHIREKRWSSESLIMRNKDRGMVSLSGPLSNIVLALIFFAVYSIFNFQIFSYASLINLWLAFFNLLPFKPLDGSKVITWDRKIWLLSFVVSLIGLGGILLL